MSCRGDVEDGDPAGRLAAVAAVVGVAVEDDARPERADGVNEPRRPEERVDLLRLAWMVASMGA